MLTINTKSKIKSLVCVTAVLCVTVMSNNSSAAEYTLKMATVLAEKDVTTIGLRKFAEIVDEKSSGNVEVKIFPGGQLGSGVETFEAVKNGHLDMASDSFANLATITPAFEMFHFPFLFETRKQLLSAMNSEEIKTEINNELEPTGLSWFTTFEIGGPREVGTSNKKIETAEDLSGLKFRASRSPLEIGTHEAWGAAGVTVDWPETPEAVRLGMVDGLTVPYASFYSARFYEGGLIKYILDLNFQNYALVTVVNREKFAELPEGVQTILKESATEAQQWHVNFLSEYITENIKEMKEAGVEVYSLSEEEYNKVKAKTVDTVWPKFLGQPGMSQEKLDMIKDIVGETDGSGWGYSITD